MIKDLQKALTLAVQDRNHIARQHAELAHRLLVAKKDVSYYASQTDHARVALNDANRLIGAGLLRLMTSGISHRRYLRFVKALEAQ